MLLWEQISPSQVGKGGFAPIMRLSAVVGAGAGFLTFYQRSIRKYFAFLTQCTPSVHAAPFFRLSAVFMLELYLNIDGHEEVC